MSSRTAALLVGAWLVLMGPLAFAVELAGALSTLAARGLPAILEVVLHGAAAALAASAANALFDRSPSAPQLSVVALVLVAIAGVQSLWMSWLPHQTMPAERLPWTIVYVVITAAAVSWLTRRERSFQ